MVKNLTPGNIYSLITEDFEAAWDSVASNHSKIARCNFMFGRQAMNLLEFASILCEDDSAGNAVRSLSNDLKSLDYRYFTKLPGSCAFTKEYTLPNDGNRTGNLLLWAMFDLIRHGLAHQYQQTLVNLSDKKNFYIELTGAEENMSLSVVASSPRPYRHLSYFIDNDGDLCLKVYSEILYLDIKKAIESSSLFQKGLSFHHMSRPVQKYKKKHWNPRPKFYNFDSISLENNLTAGGHKNIKP